MDIALDTEHRARTIIHELAIKVGPEQLKSETRRVRQRLEADRGGQRPNVIDIKYGRGGMLDVYFASRLQQLRDNVPDIDEDRSTSKTLERLLKAGSLDKSDFEVMRDGYKLLRRLDHVIRLTLGRSTRLPAADHPALFEIAQRMGYGTSEDLLADVSANMNCIHAAFEHVVT
jgi:glutamine synthetase adenylyltransferase